MTENWGLSPFFGWESGGAGSQSNTMSPGPRPASIPSTHAEAYLHTKCQHDPSSRLATTDIAENWGLCPCQGRGAGSRGAAESPSNRMWPWPRPTSMPSFILIHLTVCPQYTNVTDRQDRTGQRSNSIRRTVFGRPFVKRFALCYRTVVCPVCL